MGLALFALLTTLPRVPARRRAEPLLTPSERLSTDGAIHISKTKAHGCHQAYTPTFVCSRCRQVYVLGEFIFAGLVLKQGKKGATLSRRDRPGPETSGYRSSRAGFRD